MKNSLLCPGVWVASLLFLPSAHAATLTLYRNADSACKNATFVAPVNFPPNVDKTCNKIETKDRGTVYEEYFRSTDELLIRSYCQSSCNNCQTEVKLRKAECSTVRMWTPDGIKEIYAKYDPEVTATFTPAPSSTGVILDVPTSAINPPASPAASTGNVLGVSYPAVWVACVAVAYVANEMV